MAQIYLCEDSLYVSCQGLAGFQLLQRFQLLGVAGKDLHTFEERNGCRGHCPPPHPASPQRCYKIEGGGGGQTFVSPSTPHACTAKREGFTSLTSILT
jgi:hypothetical protein